MAIIEGTEFNNELIVTGTGDEVLGLAGNDTLDASPAQGNNTLDGGSGDDELFAGIDDLLLGGEGDDTLDARSGRGGNRLEAGEGNDLLFAATDDTLLGGIGNDLLFAGREDGVLKGGTGSDQFWVVQTEVPVQPNIVNRFIQGVDQIGIGGLAEYVTAFEDLSFVMQEGSTVIQATVEGEDVELAILEGFTGTLTADDFIFNQGAPALAVPGPVAEDAAFSVPENSEVGTVVGTVIATDIEITDDPEDSDQLTYEIIAGNADPNGNGTAAFTINQDTGEITVLDSGDLDFESDTTSFELTVKVTDLEGLSDEATVTINVENVNEAPVAADAEFTIDENSADGTEVGTVVAIDPDSGDTLTYVISAGNDAGAFEINETTGEITVANSAPLDFETTPSFDLTVTVSDGELTDDATVTINLNNLPEEGNDRPEIQDAEFTIDENSADGTEVGTVVATDLDGDILSYSITGGNDSGAFTIDPATGLITVVNSAPLDFETTPSFGLTVTVSDGELTDEATVTINLEDVNEAPTVDDETFTIDENSASGTEVGTVVAIDPDSGDSLTYSITGGNDSGAFTIDPATGLITVVNSAPLDFETTPSFGLTVTVSDGELTDDATVTINLNNLPEEGNDRPEIQDAEFTIDENSADGTEVGTVIATDLDGNILSYSITGGNDSGAFTIDPATGLITVVNSAPLDFETTPSFGLTVTVSDGELTDDATVTINLNDIDEDGDGVIDSIERIAGDRNRDGIEDVEQSNVASVRNPVTDEFFTLVAPVGISFKNVDVVTNPAPGITGDPEVEGFEFEDGFLTFEIEDDPNVNEPVLQVGGELDISILLPPGSNANTYWKYDTDLGWYEFTYDGETGAEFFDVEGLVQNPDGSVVESDDNVDLVVLHFIDGGRGDDDGLANGVITDPGGVGLLATPDGSLTENGGIFTVGGTSGLAVPLKFTLTENDSAFVDRMKVFRLDENNNLLSEEVIFSEVHTGLTEGLTRELQFTAGDRLGFSIETPATTFSLFRDSDQVRISELENGGYNLAWEDVNLDELLFGGDFNDFVFNVEVGDTLGLDQLVAIDQGEEERELLDLRQLPGQTVEVDITVNRDAAFDNFVGFYEIDNEEGAIGNLNPGDAGYTEAAIERSRELDLDSSNTSANLDGGSLYAPFIIANGTPDNFENVYFPFIAGNADNFDHVRLLGDNVFGFEDLFGGGDQDFNDIVVALDFTLI